MKQITIEKPDAIRIEPGAQDGFVEVVIISNISPLPVIREDEQESTEYESDIYRLTYPVTENLLGYAEKHFDVFVELAKAEEILILTALKRIARNSWKANTERRKAGGTDDRKQKPAGNDRQKRC